MTTLAKIGWGAEFHIHDGTALFEVAEVTGIGIPDETVDTVEATHFKSANAVREYIAGLIESGEGSVELNYVAGSASDTKLRAAKNGRVAVAYKFVIPTTSGNWEVTGNCLVTNVGRAVPIDDRMSQSVGLKFTGLSADAAG